MWRIRSPSGKSGFGTFSLSTGAPTATVQEQFGMHSFTESTKRQARHSICSERAWEHTYHDKPETRTHMSMIRMAVSMGSFLSITLWPADCVRNAQYIFVSTDLDSCPSDAYALPSALPMVATEQDSDRSLRATNGPSMCPEDRVFGVFDHGRRIATVPSGFSTRLVRGRGCALRVSFAQNAGDDYLGGLPNAKSVTTALLADLKTSGQNTRVDTVVFGDLRARCSER